ncbi:MAG: hypothetical protein QHD01_02860 [Bradyrhizobium sp.]|uniref:hypothetical protein n=1 Tax=Bradyrhizobium sp. TaxID=376 RepID=UPI0029A029F5|nr:hypothetical protein [Bradyrhizobium sp.]MDX3965525.1 hypothetical protein [Bradyrhizobium sp.]
MIFDYRFTYKAEYVRWKGKKRRTVFLNGIKAVEIEEVDSAAAPAAYRIRHDLGGHEDTHDVRSFKGALWWPVFLHKDPLTPSRFLALASSDWDRASRLLDPMSRTFYLNASSADAFMAQRRVSPGKFWSEIEPQEKRAEEDASKLLFCEDRVFVAAGDPLWYANLDQGARRYEVAIGHSDLDRSYMDRPYGVGFFTPGPDRKTRIECGRRALVFGLDEISMLPHLVEPGNEIKFLSEIVSPGSHNPRAPAAAELCVHASAENLRQIAWKRPELRKKVPELDDRSPGDKPTLLGDKSLLLAFIGRQATLPERYETLIEEVRTVLDRLAVHEPLAEEDDEALAKFAS